MNQPASATRELPKVDRVYSLLEWKSLDDEQRLIEGVASTPSTDRMGDVVQSRGAVFNLPLPLLWQHRSAEPIGHVIKARATDEGIAITAKIARGVLPFIDEAWALIKAGLVRGLSIGFRPLEFEPLDAKDPWGGLLFKKWEWLELSAVTIPANAEASIQTIKSIDDEILRAASGASKQGGNVVRLSSSPGVAGKSEGAVKGKVMPKLADQIGAFEAKHAANQGQMQAIMDAANEAGETLSTEQQQQFDALADENKSIMEHLTRARQLEAMQIQKATPIAPAANEPSKAADLRGNSIISVRRNLPPGTAFARYALALAASKGNLMQAHHSSKQWKDTPEVETVLKAAMDAGTTTDATWAGPLVEYQTMAGEFIDLLRPRTIVGRLNGLRRVPFNIRVAGKTQGSTVGWVGQGAPKPVSELAFNEVTLGFAKAAGIVVITQELARFSDPRAEEIIRNDLRDTMAEFMDAQFIDPAVSAVANVSPASITNGLTPTTSAGATIANITTDITAAFTGFINAELSPTSAAWIMHPLTAMALSLKRTAQDVFAYPDITMNGGTFFGLPVIVSTAVPRTTSGGAIIILVDANEIFFADDGQVALDASQEASLQMSSTPSAGAQSLVSLWQNNLIGIRAERFMNWQRRRDAAVTYIDGVFY